MSSDFYFRKWKSTIKSLHDIVQLDIQYQETKAHDQTMCDAVKRLTEVIVQYMAVYNDALECLNQNLQVQKTKFMVQIIQVVVSRILELKKEIRKLEASKCQFFSNGLTTNHLTMYDAELSDVPSKCNRSEEIVKIIELAKKGARDIKEKKELLRKETEDTDAIITNWCEVDSSESSTVETNDIEGEKLIMSEESLYGQRLIDLIKAHERSRQTVFRLKQQKQKRERWQKALEGKLNTKGSYKLREKAARFIQAVIREYFQIKRQRLKQRQRDELLGITLPKEPCTEATNKAEELRESRSKLKKKYQEEWIVSCEMMKENYQNRKIEDIAEDYRDYVRCWFKEWFDKIRFFHNVPSMTGGGSALIIKEEFPSPEVWLEKYNVYLVKKQADKGKTPQELKFEKISAKREKKRLKNLMAKQHNIEAKLLKKMMRNPEMHPGYNYPQSKYSDCLLKAINSYKSTWGDLDKTNNKDVKEKSVEAIDFDNVCAEIKLKAVEWADQDMRTEFKILNRALKYDYLRNGEKILEPIIKKKKRNKNEPEISVKISHDHIISQLQDLILKGFVKEYPKTKLQDFLGDPNFAGEETRCNFEHAYPFNAEIRDIWWERCQKMARGFNKILLIGPKGNGKTTLVHALANMNDAILFELDLSIIPKDLIIAPYLQLITNSVVACARAVQPSVIHIKHVQRLFYNKVPPRETDINLNIVYTFWIKKLFRKIHKTDTVTIIGTCTDPWLAKSSPLLKQFPTVILLPNTTYSAIVQLLKSWVAQNPVISQNMDVLSLAQVLQGFSYGFLKKQLQDFMSPERRIKVAVRGLTPIDVYNYITNDSTEEKIDYKKYLKWYEKTYWGKKEKKHLEEQEEFKKLMIELAEKAKEKETTSK